jgi:hypothetical protein
VARDNRYLTYLVEEVCYRLAHAAVGPATMHKDQALEEPELAYSIVGGHSRLSTFFTNDTNPDVGFLNHGDIIGPISNRESHDIQAILD